MAKIFSILTLVVAAVAIYFALEGEKRVKAMHESGAKLVSNLKRTEDTLRDTRAELEKTKADLATTRADLEKTRTDLQNKTDEFNKLNAEYTKVSSELKDTNAKLAEINATIKELFPDRPEGDIKTLVNDLKTLITDLSNTKKEQAMQIVTLQNDKTNLETKVGDLENTKKQQGDKIDQQTGVIKKYAENIMVKGVRGRVEAVNAGWGFCVVSIGDKQGAASNKILIVSRNGQAIGKVRITNVEANQSVADILPSTFVKGTFVAPGDSVIYTGEDKAKIETTPGAPVEPALPTHERP